ncbi:MAG: hypothetical protein V3T83_11270 [Acidobacteriota bacterium]
MRKTIFTALAVLALSAVGAAGSEADVPSKPFEAVRIWLDPNGQPLPFQSDEQALDFLRAAEVTDKRPVGSGVGGAQKVRLEKDGLAVNACFRTIREDYDKAFMRDGTFRFNFRDDAVFEVAAYELSRMLGLDNIPPVVVRVIDGQRGSLQLWIEKAMTESKRLKEDAQPPSGMHYLRQIQNMRIFDNLIYNVDRNKGNMLIDSHWKLWMIDHTRSFRRYKQLSQPEFVAAVERNLWERIQALDADQVQQRLSPYLKAQEIRGLLKRRDTLVQHIQKLIDEKGENCVLFSI